MKSMRLGIAGLGTVGSGVLKLLLQSEGAGSVFSTLSNSLQVTGVSARHRNRDRGVPLEGIGWFDDPQMLAVSPDIDIFVELIGGEEGPARASVERALDAGKHVVTANKALMATHGIALAKKAEANGVSLRFEAAVAGAVPIINAVRAGMAAASVTRIVGILNGTCNYILSRMEKESADYASVLGDAQKLGFAEADPTLDVGGFDAAHKLAILSGLVFGVIPADGDMAITGIDGVSLEDIQTAQSLGYSIRLLAIGTISSERQVSLSVAPVLIEQNHTLARTAGANNHIFVEGPPLGQLNLGGPGAGSGPTASAIASDLASIVYGEGGPAFGRPADEITLGSVVNDGSAVSRYVLRLSGVTNRASVMEILNRHAMECEIVDTKEAADKDALLYAITGEISPATLQVARTDLETVTAQENGVAVYPIAVL